MIVLSVASGTSADGLDLAAVDARWAGDDLEVELVDTGTADWPEGLADRLLAVLPPARTTAAELCALDNEVGRAAGAAAAAAAARVEAGTGRRPDLVVSPGQTVHHEVRDGACLGTLQVGQPAWVVEATGLPVVSDLRARDVTAGGHGAPLVGRFDQLWLADLAAQHGPVAALNLGGIANVSVVAPERPLLAWDTGPANCLIDVAAARASDGALRCDLDGAMARRGRVCTPLLERLLAHPHFAATPPASTGRETFSATWLDSVLTATGPVPSDDVLATLTELTARTVAAALEPFALTEVVASGGGVRNPALWDALVRHLGPVRVRPSDDLGLPADAKEGVMWAVLGFLTWYGVPGASPATGAPTSRVLGRISPGDAPLRLPEPAQRGPRGLRVSTRKVCS